MYWYTYKRCKQKHAITKGFDINENFVTKDEGIIPETSFLGTSRAGKRMRTIDTSRDIIDYVVVSAPSDVSLREEIAPCSDKVSLLCHAGDVSSLVVVTGDQDNPKNTLGRTEELEPLPSSLDPITHIDNLGE